MPMGFGTSRSCGRTASASSAEGGEPTATAVERRAGRAACRGAPHRRQSSIAWPTNMDLKDELDGAWAARPLELIREGGRTMLVLEDPGGEPLDRLARRADGGGTLSAPRHRHRRGPRQGPPARPRPQGHQAGQYPGEQRRRTSVGSPASASLRVCRASGRRPTPPEVIAGTLAYMAPEQTGRMNRSIDSRSDLYALGVMFYQMLTGAPAVHRLRSDGMGPLPYRAESRCRLPSGWRTFPAAVSPDRHEAARQDGRGALPDRRRPRARSAALPGRMGAQGAHR